MGAKDRLDRLLVERGLADSRTRAQALIRTGMVEVDGQIEDKPGSQFSVDAAVTVREALPFVGRGGVKLDAALEAFGVDPAGRIALDVGASTGGFTDALLQRGAKQVYAVDVGRGQLAWKLRTDPRVIAMERTDIRDVAELDPVPVVATVDVAFISLRLVLPSVATLITADGAVLALVKPQFEAGRDEVGRGGVVKDPAIHRRVLEDTAKWCVAAGWRLLGGCPSPVTGASGNREFFLHLGARDHPGSPAPVGAVVDAALR